VGRQVSRESRKPLLVTGAHRSGTGWVGQVLASSPTPLGYVWEPFSPRHRPGTLPVRFPRYFEYVCHENADGLSAPLADTLAFRYRPLAELRAVRGPKDAARMGRDWSRFRRQRRRRAAALLKDPIALFSSEWLVDTFSMEAIVLVRHPAAFASSLKRRGWRHNFQSFLDQPLLMRDFLAPHEEQIRVHARSRQDIVDDAILLWNVLYDAVGRFRERRPDWSYVRLEDLARDPLPRFRALFERHGLEWSDRVASFIVATSNDANPTVESHGGSVRRNSDAHSWSWTRELTPAEIERVRERTQPFAARFYGDADWIEPGATTLRGRESAPACGSRSA
jgi:hypothetical protein